MESTSAFVCGITHRNLMICSICMLCPAVLSINSCPMPFMDIHVAVLLCLENSFLLSSISCSWLLECSSLPPLALSIVDSEEMITDLNPPPCHFRLGSMLNLLLEKSISKSVVIDQVNIRTYALRNSLMTAFASCTQTAQIAKLPNVTAGSNWQNWIFPNYYPSIEYTAVTMHYHMLSHPFLVNYLDHNFDWDIHSGHLSLDRPLVLVGIPG